MPDRRGGAAGSDRAGAGRAQVTPADGRAGLPDAGRASPPPIAPGRELARIAVRAEWPEAHLGLVQLEVQDGLALPVTVRLPFLIVKQLAAAILNAEVVSQLGPAAVVQVGAALSAPPGR